MPAIADLQVLKEAQLALAQAEFTQEQISLFKKYNQVGYKNLIRLLNGDTPEKLKGESNENIGPLTADNPNVAKVLSKKGTKAPAESRTRKRKVKNG